MTDTLRKLAMRCKFSNLEEMPLDRFALGLRDEKLRLKLAGGEDIDLKKALSETTDLEWSQNQRDTKHIACASCSKATRSSQEGLAQRKQAAHQETLIPEEELYSMVMLQKQVLWLPRPTRPH